MTEKELKLILDSEEPVKIVNKHFKDEIELLREIKNYGTNLIIRCVKTSERKLYNALILGVLLKHAVAMLDSIEIQVSNAMLLGANLPARSLFETCLYIEWILEKETEKRAKQYYVWHLRKEKQWHLNLLEGEKEKSKFSDMYTIVSKTIDDFNSEAEKNINKIDVLLDKDDYKEINAEFDRLKKIKCREVNWFVPWGADSLLDMANKLGRITEYYAFYDDFSKIMHALVVKEHITFYKGKVSFENIRKLNGISTIMNVTIGLILNCYMEILNFYRPSEIENFRKKYFEEWRTRFSKIKSVEYKGGEGISLDF